MNTTLFLIAAATSADIFAASAGIGASGIRYPPGSMLASSFTSAAVLWAAVLTAGAAGGLLTDTRFSSALSVAAKLLLIAMGLWEIFGERLKKYISSMSLPSRKKGAKSPLSFRLINNGAAADSDLSRTISVKEAVIMGFALSADSALSGFGAGLGGMEPLAVFIASAVFGTAFIFAGYLSGKAAAKKISAHTSLHINAGCISGIILILLAVIM